MMHGREKSDSAVVAVKMLCGFSLAHRTVNRRWIGTPYRHPKGTPLSGEFGR